MSASTLPITLLLFLTTQGYGGCRTIYRAMLDGWDRQLPLSTFRLRYAHLKVTPGEESIAEAITADLQQRGFVVESATGDWVRGQAHFNAYLADQVKVSKDALIYDNPYVLWLDHDYVPMCHVDPLPKVLARMTRLIESSPDIVSARFLREEDADALAPDRTVAIEPDQHLAWSAHFNWNPVLLRSRDYHLACKVIEDNWTVATRKHGEALWREVLAPFSRSSRKHAVWLPSYACVANLGVPHYTEVAQRLGLRIAPNPPTVTLSVL